MERCAEVPNLASVEQHAERQRDDDERQDDGAERHPRRAPGLRVARPRGDCVDRVLNGLRDGDDEGGHDEHRVRCAGVRTRLLCGSCRTREDATKRPQP